MNSLARKSIGLPWTLDVPAEWNVKKLKWIAAVRPSNVDKKAVVGERSVRLCNYVDVYKNDFITQQMTFMEATATDSQIATFTLKAGDVLITKDSEEWNDIAVPAYVPVDLDGVVCGYHLAHVRPRLDVVCGPYLFRAFAAEGLADQFRVAANGITRYGLSTDDITNALFPVPPLSHQRIIATFLDRKTAQIDQIIVKKLRLIELLQEKCQAVINQAVTKGLSPSSSSTPSTWAVERLKFRMKKIEQGWSPQCENRQAEVGEWGVLKVGCMNSGIYDETENKALPPTEKPDPELEVRVGDVLMSRSNTIELVGSVGIVHKTQGRILLCDKLYRLIFDHTKVFPEYVVHLLRSHFARCQIERDASGASPSMKNISNDRVRDLVLPFPPRDEQRRILQWIDGQITQIARISTSLERQLHKLREYRQTLISAAVTGEIDLQASITISTPVAKANPFFRRSVLAAEIVDRMHSDETFGRVKFQKTLFLCEHHLSLPEVGSEYRRAAAGPFDNRLIRSVESQLERSKWYKAVKNDVRTTYIPMEKAGGHKLYFGRYWGQFEDRFAALVNLLKPMTTQQAEIVATLYAAWNDFLIKNEPFDDPKIVKEVLSNWDDSKARIAEDRWYKALVWMRQKGLTPHGFGRSTEQST